MHAVSRRLLAAAALLGVLVLAGGAGADSKDRDHDCHIKVSDLRFGSYNPNAPQDKQSQTEVRITCEEDRSKDKDDDYVRVTVSEGRSGSCRNRHMQRGSGGDRLFYNVYRDAARTQVAGDSDDGCLDLVPPFRVDDDEFEIDVTLYGSIPAGQYTAAGMFFDTLIVEVEFYD